MGPCGDPREPAVSRATAPNSEVTASHLLPRRPLPAVPSLDAPFLPPPSPPSPPLPGPPNAVCGIGRSSARRCAARRASRSCPGGGGSATPHPPFEGEREGGGGRCLRTQEAVLRGAGASVKLCESTRGPSPPLPGLFPDRHSIPPPPPPPLVVPGLAPPVGVFPRARNDWRGLSLWSSWVHPVPPVPPVLAPPLRLAGHLSSAKAVGAQWPPAVPITSRSPTRQSHGVGPIRSPMLHSVYGAAISRPYWFPPGCKKVVYLQKKSGQRYPPRLSVSEHYVYVDPPHYLRCVMYTPSSLRSVCGPLHAEDAHEKAVPPITFFELFSAWLPMAVLWQPPPPPTDWSTDPCTPPLACPVAPPLLSLPIHLAAART